MNKLLLRFIFGYFILSYMATTTAATHRVPQYSHDKVTIVETVVYSSKDQALKMHRHEYDRVLVALTNGILKITTDKGQSHEFKIERGKAYFLARDTNDELHSDENISGPPIKVLLIELH